ncbi:TPR-like protein [Trametopsis cervina]|nr:TPR-like protein [Trametopsis cervina]
MTSTALLHSSGSNPFANRLNRDALLAYAYHLYDRPNVSHAGLTPMPLTDPLPVLTQPEDVYRLRLLPLLNTLRSLQPKDIAVLLLLACTFHALGDYESSLRVSEDMLAIDPDFVEAMNNIGTAMQALGKSDQAYEWWWKAIQNRPTYWDAIDNLLGFLLARAQDSQNTDHASSLYSRALEVCSFVQQKAVGESSRLLAPLQPHELCRLQRLYLTSASLRLHAEESELAIRNYFSGIELMLQQGSHKSVKEPPYSMRELILAGFVAGFIVQSSPDRPFPRLLTACFEASSAGLQLQPGADILQAVRKSGDSLISALLQLGGNALPFLLLLPEQVARIPSVLFPSTSGILPALCTWSDATPSQLQPPPVLTQQQANVMTGNIFLALAKYYQDLPSSSVPIPGFSGTLNVNHALAILFYYFALSLAPSPSTHNNMGIILSSISDTVSWTSELGERIVVSGSDLARIFYTAGLQLEPSHPHLLTNLGSLYKDEGNLESAVQLYSKALAVKPDFDIALANMGNALKDTGRSWEALDFYRRAVGLNADLPEAVCGLVSSMASVCDWRGRDSSTNECGVDDNGRYLPSGAPSGAFTGPSLMQRMVNICDAQLNAAYYHNLHCVSATQTLFSWTDALQTVFDRPLSQMEYDHWSALFRQFGEVEDRAAVKLNEGGFVIRFINWLQPRLQRRWYVKVYGKALVADREMTTDPQLYSNLFNRPKLPRTMSPPVVPSVLPFNTFIYPLSARMIRLISHRNALRISFTALSQPWLPEHVYAPPNPPVNGVLNIGYVTNDVNNHPLSHLMQSVFGLHDRRRFRVFMYTTSPWDGTSYRLRISGDVEVFVDASSWSTQQIVEHIKHHKIHILINLGGYTKGARNDVFAARPCPVQMQLMGYAGTLGSGWCDYLVCDPTSCPPDLSATELWRMKRHANIGSTVPDAPGSSPAVSLDLDADPDPEQETDEWVFCEKFIYLPHTYMVTDHKQSFRMDENLSIEERRRTPVTTLWRNEEQRRGEMRQVWFPGLPQSWIVFANFNQGIFAVWLRILARVPNSILWLLRFPLQGEEYLMQSAKLWAGEEVASRIRFTDVAKKDVHVYRGRVADLFLDTVECNAHTIAADVIWPGTPILTFPKHRHKMCSRVAASMANATGFGDQMVVNSLEEYENRAVALANSVKYIPWTEDHGVTIHRGQGELISLRRNLFLNRDKMPLFDTERWTRNIEKAYWEAWRRWVEGTQFEQSDEWEACEGPEKQSGSIWVPDQDPIELIRYD